MTHRCQACGFTVYNRRYPKCESCGALLEPGIALSDTERSVLLERERFEAEQARRRRMNPYRDLPVSRT